MPRLLQGGAVPTLVACAPVLGYGPSWLARWWKRYREGGLAGLLVEPPQPSRPSPASLAGIEGEPRAGRIASLEDAHRWCPRGGAAALGRRRPVPVALVVRRGRAFERGGVLPVAAGVDQAWFQRFLDEFAMALGGRRVDLVLDGAGSHRADLAWPERVAPLPLPPDSPALNPAEQGFRVLRTKLANRPFADLAGLEAARIECLRAFWADPAVLRRLTAYPWWRAGVRAIAPSPP